MRCKSSRIHNKFGGLAHTLAHKYKKAMGKIAKPAKSKIDKIKRSKERPVKPSASDAEGPDALSSIVLAYFHKVAKIDANHAKLSRAQRRGARLMAKSEVQQRCFSVKAARRHCKWNRAKEAHHSRVAACMSNRFETDSPQLHDTYKQYVFLQRKALAWKWRSSLATDYEDVRDETWARIAELDKSSSFKHQYALFEKECGAETSRIKLELEEDALVKRMLTEADKCSKTAEGAWSDSQMDPCPEASACAYKRLTNEMRGAEVATKAYFGSMVASTLVGALLGTLVFPGFGTVQGAVAGFGAPVSAPVSVLAGGLAATELLPSGRCFPAQCEYDASDDRCIMREPSSNNPFGWLPSSGQKCLEVRENTCELRVCEGTDYLTPLNNMSKDLFGRMGYRDKGVYNCLSATGKAFGLDRVDSLPDGTQNTIVNRIHFYQSLINKGLFRMIAPSSKKDIDAPIKPEIAAAEDDSGEAISTAEEGATGEAHVPTDVDSPETDAMDVDSPETDAMDVDSPEKSEETISTSLEDAAGDASIPMVGDSPKTDATE
eukprot:TRINITY_DN2005_c0_g1_i1.p1 TRINITY_DN2005_c0_g1~~TRINITY_DN2005_c0_g1_i1.p1  ORF type:complete len:643 (-),score=57.36 TRINITY_DN2005_c0_g1_i1:49-1689(-)